MVMDASKATYAVKTGLIAQRAAVRMLLREQSVSLSCEHFERSVLTHLREIPRHFAWTTSDSCEVCGPLTAMDFVVVGLVQGVGIHYEN